MQRGDAWATFVTAIFYFKEYPLCPAPLNKNLKSLVSAGYQNSYLGL